MLDRFEWLITEQELKDTWEEKSILVVATLVPNQTQSV